MGVGMAEIIAAEMDDFPITTNGGVVVLAAILSKKTFHQPCLCEPWRNIEDSIKKDLRNLPAFFGNCAGGMPPINADNRVFRLASCWSRFCGSLIVEKH